MRIAFAKLGSGQKKLIKPPYQDSSRGGDINNIVQRREKHSGI
jgi:hypothetical protein